MHAVRRAARQKPVAWRRDVPGTPVLCFRAFTHDARSIKAATESAILGLAVDWAEVMRYD
jgi:hypothetical protein